MLAEVAVRPRAPLRLPRMTGGELVLARRGDSLERLLVIREEAMLVRARHGKSGELRFGAEPVEPDRLEGPGVRELTGAGEDTLQEGIARMRRSFGVDDDLGDFYRHFRDDPLLGPALRGRLEQRPQRRPVAWEALLWAITEQLIEYRRAARIQRQLIRRFGVRMSKLATVPSPAAIAAASPAELEACGLGARRAVAMIRVAREVQTGRVDPEDPAGDRRLLTIPMIGPWTIACLGLRGRGDPDALLAGDLAQVKLVGYLKGLGRLAEIEEVEEFYAPYAPWRGLAGEYLVAAAGAAVHGPGNRARIRRQAFRPAA